MALRLFADPFFTGDLAKMDTEFKQYQQMLGACDIHETADAYVYKLDAPGLQKADVKVQVVDGNVLQISGERKREHEEKDDSKHYHRVERSYGRFMRSFRLPDNVDTTGINAAVEHGVLQVKAPKNKKAAPKSIDINVA